MNPIQNNKLKVAFFGTSDRSEPILAALKKSFNLVLCITKTDSLVGRKQLPKESGVKKWAKDNSIPYICIPNFKNDHVGETLEQLKCSDVTFGVVADFSLLIPEEIINYFSGKLINIHFSSLPRYRGASPVQFALINGDDVIGISYILVSKELDRGALLSTIEYKIPNKCTSGELFTTLFTIAADNIPHIIDDYDTGSIVPQPQAAEQASYTYSPSHPKNTFIYKEDAKLNWQEPVELLERKIRAYNPWPIAWTTLKQLEETTKIPTLRLRSTVDRNLTFKIVSAQLTDGLLVPIEVQVENKKRTTWEAFINGYSVRD